jgi:hypothetical protein
MRHGPSADRDSGPSGRGRRVAVQAALQPSSSVSWSAGRWGNHGAAPQLAVTHTLVSQVRLLQRKALNLRLDAPDLAEHGPTSSTVRGRISATAANAHSRRSGPSACSYAARRPSRHCSLEYSARTMSGSSILRRQDRRAPEAATRRLAAEPRVQCRADSGNSPSWVAPAAFLDVESVLRCGAAIGWFECVSAAGPSRAGRRRRRTTAGSEDSSRRG